MAGGFATTAIGVGEETLLVLIATISYGRHSRQIAEIMKALVERRVIMASEGILPGDLFQSSISYASLYQSIQLLFFVEKGTLFFQWNITDSTYGMANAT